MPLKIVGDEHNNEVRISASVREKCKGTIVFNGTGSIFSLEDPVLAGSIYCTLADRATIRIGKECVYGMLTLHALAEGALISIGDRVGLNGSVEMGTHEKASITVGDECLFAGGVTVTASDVHTVYDLATHERLNPPRDITIGRHVWVAAHSTILKGANVGEMSVVAACAVVTGSSPANCMIAGVPARVVRRGIYWRR